MRGLIGPLQETIFLIAKIVAFLLIVVLLFTVITSYADDACIQSTTQSVNDIISEIKKDAGDMGFEGSATLHLNKQCIDSVVIADKQPNIGTWADIKCYDDKKNEGGIFFITYYRDAGFSDYASSVSYFDIAQTASYIKRSLKNKCQYAPLMLTYTSTDVVKADGAKLEIRNRGQTTYSGVYLPSDKNEEMTKYCIHYTVMQKTSEPKNTFRIDSITKGEC